jgi:hypothetical protein
MFALSDSRVRDYTELATGRFGELDLATQLAQARLRTSLPVRPARQDDRPAGRMTLLAAE